ncbi:MAG: ferrous iron transport protein A [Clostridia bacterium]|nr:ferrous iron transport protein A [Clostridia bacterium]
MEQKSKNISVNIPLTMLKAGQEAKIVTVKTEDNQKLRKLAAFGIFPGTEIQVIQCYPSIVIQAGFTQIALDSEIASEIIVNLNN